MILQIITSILISTVVTLIILSSFKKYMNKWLKNFFEEETLRIKKWID